MFKLTKSGSGLRRSHGTTPSGAGRISGLHGLRGYGVPGPRTVAFQPDTQQGHGMDSANSRLSGLEK